MSQRKAPFRGFVRFTGQYPPLGPAISKSLVELMGGTIWFASEEGRGSTFYFVLEFDRA